jgi:hypothetical protein
MRALTSGHLRAMKDNEGRWQIDPEALDDWMSLRSHGRQSPDVTSGQPSVITMDTPETMVRLAVAEARLQDMTAERDRLAALLEKALEQRSRGIIARIFGQ